jgi:hypothetical protein
MSEADLGLAGLFGDFKGNFRAVPLCFVFGELQVGVQDEPDDFLARNEFRYFLFGIMDVLVAIGEDVTKFVGAAFNFPRPPSTNMIDLPGFGLP